MCGSGSRTPCGVSFPAGAFSTSLAVGQSLLVLLSLGWFVVCVLTPPGKLPLPCFTLGFHPCTPGLHLRAHPLPHAGGSRLGLTGHAGSPAQAVREWTVNVGFRSYHLRSRPPPQGVPCAQCWWFPAGAHRLGRLPCASFRAWIENLWPLGRRESGTGMLSCVGRPRDQATIYF